MPPWCRPPAHACLGVWLDDPPTWMPWIYTWRLRVGAPHPRGVGGAYCWGLARPLGACLYCMAVQNGTCRTYLVEAVPTRPVSCETDNIHPWNPMLASYLVRIGLGARVGVEGR
jgi:hypothetical protein